MRVSIWQLMWYYFVQHNETKGLKLQDDRAEEESPATETKTEQQSRTLMNSSCQQERIGCFCRFHARILATSGNTTLARVDFFGFRTYYKSQLCARYVTLRMQQPHTKLRRQVVLRTIHSNGNPMKWEKTDDQPVITRPGGVWIDSPTESGVVHGAVSPSRCMPRRNRFDLGSAWQHLLTSSWGRGGRMIAVCKGLHFLSRVL